jgi:hypothetical protein
MSDPPSVGQLMDALDRALAAQMVSAFNTLSTYISDKKKLKDAQDDFIKNLTDMCAAYRYAASKIENLAVPNATAVSAAPKESGKTLKDK